MERKLASKILKVSGMTCSSCEVKIEKKLKALSGIVSVKATFGDSSVSITWSTTEINLDTITAAIEEMDYPIEKPQVQENSTVVGEKRKGSIYHIIGLIIILLAGYMIIKHTVGFNFIPEVNQSMGFGILFVIGLMTSLHCIAMCGGINLSQCIQYKQGSEDVEQRRISKFKPSLLYNIGRVVSYTIIGGLVGALGSAVSFSGAAKGIVAILSGIFMVIMGLNMLNIFPWLRKFNLRLPKSLGHIIHSKNKRGPFYVGLLNGLMPCGPLQAMQLYALGTGSFLAGAFSMFMFSLGTVPLMFGFGAVSSMLSGNFTKKMLKASAVLVMALGVVMLSRGLGLSGINVSAATGDTDNSAIVEKDVQVVTTVLESRGYPAFTVQKGIPVRWVMQVDAKNLNGCNNELVIPEYGIQKKLVVGDNIIEFTPTKEGKIVYTCWMGMIRSNINVVSDITSTPNNQGIFENVEPPAGSASGGCCGG